MIEKTLKLTFDLTRKEADALILDFAKQHGYLEQVTDADDNLIDNPVAPQDFAVEVIDGFIRESVAALRKRRARQDADEQAQQALEAMRPKVMTELID